MRLAWLVAVFAVAFCLLSDPVAKAGTVGTDPFDPVAVRHEMKVTYCLEQRNKRFYRTENLEDLCVLKVAFFDEQVSSTDPGY